MKCGSLFSGIGGLELGLGHEPVWFCEMDPYASTVLARHYPQVPNLGDITKVDWSKVERPDIVCGGFPCQDLSYAGKGAGIREGTRSGLWFDFARAVRSLRPRFVVVENVTALLTRGFGIVLGDLAEAGYDARWFCLRASDIGAPHKRERLFVVAAHTNGLRLMGERPAVEEMPGMGDGQGLDARTAGNSSHAVAAGAGLQGRTEPDPSRPVRPDTASRDWATYEPAIRRWEELRGEPAPEPVADGRLTPDFVEWLMGFPIGWTEGIPWNQRLKCLGNAVVPQVAAVVAQELAA